MPHVSRELMLIKINCSAEQRGELVSLASVSTGGPFCLLWGSHRDPLRWCATCPSPNTMAYPATPEPPTHPHIHTHCRFSGPWCAT